MLSRNAFHAAINELYDEVGSVDSGFAEYGRKAALRDSVYFDRSVRGDEDFDAWVDRVVYQIPSFISRDGFMSEYHDDLVAMYVEESDKCAS